MGRRIEANPLHETTADVSEKGERAIKETCSSEEHTPSLLRTAEVTLIDALLFAHALATSSPVRARGREANVSL